MINKNGTITPLQYIRQTQGAVAVIFSLMLTPITMLMSASLDFSHVSFVQTQLAYAADAAALAVARYNLTDSPALANKIYYANYSGDAAKKGSNFTITVSSDKKTVTVNASQVISPLVGLFQGGNVSSVAVVSITERLPLNFELAMVLDVTG